MNCENLTARERNLLIKITHFIFESESNLNLQKNMLSLKYTVNDLTKKFYFKSSDINNYKSNLFDNDGILKLEIQERIKTYLENHDKFKSNEDEEKLKNVYNNLKEEILKISFDEKIIDNLFNEAKDICYNLHWKYMPIYKEEYISNSRVLPEDDLECYYRNFHAIEDLYWYITDNENKLDWKSTDGEINLNIELNFKIYTMRWGHYDNYKLKRTNTGWLITTHYNGGKCEKDGSGALIELLEHDSVCYPKEGIKFALESLWNEADTTEMSIEELQFKLNDIAKWIEDVEKVTHKSQPNWCNYY